MTIEKFTAEMARFGIRATRDPNHTLDIEESDHGDSHASMNPPPPPRHDPYVPPATSTKVDMEYIKAVHGKVQVEVVKNATAARVSRCPVTMGELSDALMKDTNFDPFDHCFPTLPRNYFQEMTSADRAEVAWSCIESRRGVATKPADSISPCAASSAGDITTRSHWQTSLSTQWTTTRGEDPGQAASRDRYLPTDVEYDGATYYGHATAVVPYMGSRTMMPTDGPSCEMMALASCFSALDPNPLPPPVPRFNIQSASTRDRIDEKHSLSIETIPRALMAGINPPKYKGEFTEEKIHNSQCPEDQNTSLHIEGFPAGTTEKDVLSRIRFAAIRKICIHPAVPGRFATTAVDITFFSREAAEYCFERGVEGVFRFLGNTLKFMWNKNKCRPADGEEMRQSRVLVIRGPESVVSMEAVENLLHQKLVFELVSGETWRMDDGDVTVYLEFCKLRGQARSAKKLLEEVIVELDLRVSVEFGEDPCGPH